MSLRVPAGLAASCHKTPKRAAWLSRLPDTVEELRHSWELKLDESLNAEEASCSYVTAVVCKDGTPAVLKIPMPHMEGEQEIQGLRFWNGDPTVRLLAADDTLGAMLLERCQPGTTLRARAEYDQDLVIADLLRRLWRSPSAPHAFRPLASLTQYWSEETLAQSQHWFDAALVRDGLHLFKELPCTAKRQVLLATDLHAGNILQAERQPWLVIDPKPFLGDPAYDATQHLFNCVDRLQSDPEKTIRRLSDLLGVEYERVRLWTFARAAAEPRDDWNSAGVALALAIRR
jgi:streptomycin 6-kinase